MAEALTRAKEFGADVVDEIKKVTWPDWPQLKNATLVIIVFVLIVAVIIWIMDLASRGVLDLLLGLFTR
ncbi:MAG: preprotein translocase subunit SecE [Gemmatimonadetes bacterium]|nr:preprotein translocase subunit SecE [Gemmatimonadota bacterium]